VTSPIPSQPPLAGSSDGAPPEATEAQSNDSATLVVVEEPFKPFERPRSEGAIHAAGQDEEIARWNVGGTGDPSFISSRAGYHPGARVVVDTKWKAGNLPRRARHGLSQAGVLAQSRSRGYWPFRICYEDALRRDAQQQGETRLRLTIGRSGRVTRVHLLKTELDSSAGECLRAAAQKLSYRPGPRSLVAIDLLVKFWPGDAPVPSAGPPTGTPPINPGTLDVARFRALAEQAMPQIRDCYGQGLGRDPKLWGRIELLLHLAADGSVQSVNENESRFPDPEVTRCVIAAVGELDYPPPQGGELEFIQAFRLGSEPRPESATEPEMASKP